MMFLLKYLEEHLVLLGGDGFEKEIGELLVLVSKSNSQGFAEKQFTQFEDSRGGRG